MMDGLAVIGFVFGLVAFIRVEKLIKTLKAQGNLNQDYKEEFLKAKSIEDYKWWDSELHFTIVKACKNNMVINIYQAIHRARHQIEWTEMNKDRIDEYGQEHTRIVDAFAKRDSVALREALKIHLQSVGHNMLNPHKSISP